MGRGEGGIARTLPEPEIRRARTLDHWSVKDVLAHLLACDEETNTRLRLIERDQADRVQWFESMAFGEARAWP